MVNGKNYKVVGPEHKAYKITYSANPFNDNQTEYDVSNNVLTVKYKSNSIIGLRKIQ